MSQYAAADVIAQHASPEARKRIVAHWALDSINSARDGFADEKELGDKIIARFAEQNNVSFAATAGKRFHDFSLLLSSSSPPLSPSS